VSARLLEEINVAVKAVNEAERDVTTAQAELVSRSKRVGLLLLEAKKQYSAVKDFEAFLKKVDGLKLSRAYDLLKLAGGRTTDEELKREARERQQKKRFTPSRWMRPTHINSSGAFPLAFECSAACGFIGVLIRTASASSVCRAT
jgi:hypothetical protein